MSKAGLPDKWAQRLIARGFVDPRFKHDVASMSALSAKTGLHTSTISALMSGRRKPSVETVQLLVAELGSDVAGWLGVAIREPYQPPPEADLLTTRQRKALTELIRSIVADEQEGGGEHGDRSAPTKKPGSGPTLLAVASGGGVDEDLAEKVDRQAAEGRAEMKRNIDRMNEKKPGK